ncbi:G patch domain-containing protein 4 [Hyalella azteca]|uniref:G patch domain-containing protein 4 n=1 Tax=Hyalella azteca TaxID=294128 RepID=A0A8B7PL62_HYAAZ|nr:G patch domain-containing protein 4 [Hyalella azteca]
MTEHNFSNTFAAKQLAKFGWKKGMGLGRQNDGISEPIHIRRRSDKLGIGHDAGENFSHWWDNAYNQAVGNLKVVTSKNGSVEVKSYKGSCTSEMKPNLFSRSLLYDNFNRAGTLMGTTNHSDTSDSDSDEDQASASQAVDISTGNGLLLDLSDDQLLKLCGGATAHKGARHGIRMTGKMKRLEEMAANDAALVAQWKLKEEGRQAAKTPITELPTMPTKLWKNRSSTSSKTVIGYTYDDETQSQVSAFPTSNPDSSPLVDVDSTIKKKKKLKEKIIPECVPDEASVIENEKLSLENIPILLQNNEELSRNLVKKKRKSDRRSEQISESTLKIDTYKEPLCNEEVRPKKKRKLSKKTGSVTCEENCNEREMIYDEDRKKLKKKKTKGNPLSA